MMTAADARHRVKNTQKGLSNSASDIQSPRSPSSDHYNSPKKWAVCRGPSSEKLQHSTREIALTVSPSESFISKEMSAKAVPKSDDMVNSRQKKKRPDAFEGSKNSLTVNTRKVSLCSSNTSLNASKSSPNASERSPSREHTEKTSIIAKPASTSVNKKQPKTISHMTNQHNSSSKSSSSNNLHRSRSTSTGQRRKSRSSSRDDKRQQTQPTASTMPSLPIMKLGNNLFVIDRPRQHSNARNKTNVEEQEARIQSAGNHQILTKKERAWEGITDDIKGNEGLFTRHVLPESIACEMKDRMPGLIHSSFSSLRSEMTSLTQGTVITAIINNNYVLQQPMNVDPMQDFLGGIAENMFAKSKDDGAGDGNCDALQTGPRTSQASNVSDKKENEKMDTSRRRRRRSTTTTSSTDSNDIQEFHARRRKATQENNDENEGSQGEDGLKCYDPTQTYGRATVRPQIRQVGDNTSSIMPELMDSSFSSLQSEVTDIQSIISTAKNYIVKDQRTEDDDPMVAFLGRVTIGLQARQMLIDEGRIEEQNSAVALYAVDEDNADQTADEKDLGLNEEDNHPDENDLSGSDAADIDEEQTAKDTRDDHYDFGSEDEEEDLLYNVSYQRPNTPGGIKSRGSAGTQGSVPSLTSFSTSTTLLQTDGSNDPLTKWAANLREELTQTIVAGNSNTEGTPEQQTLSEMEKALARAAEIAAQEKNETDITRVVLDEEVTRSVLESNVEGAAYRPKKIKKKFPPGSSGQLAQLERKAAPGKRKVSKKKKRLPIRPLSAEGPEKFGALFNDEPHKEYAAQRRTTMSVATVKTVARTVIPIPKQSKREKYEPKSTLKSLKEKFQSILRQGKKKRRDSPHVTVGGDEEKFFPRELQEEDDDEEEASFLYPACYL